jgi:dipeptidyl aminopeptidase/acylaminoacyl peptidase
MFRRLAIAIAVAAAAAAATAATAQERHALTVQEFLSLDRPGEPAISPDARWVAYHVTTTDLGAYRRRTDLWLVPAAGGEPRRISTDSLGGRSARWSPDSRALAYVNTRGGTPQVWVFEPASGERRQLTSLSTGADGPVWAPSGQAIAFVSQVYPDCGEDACNRRRAAEQEQKPSRARVADHLLYRHWNTWDDGTRSHLFVVAAQGGTPRDLLAGKDWDTPVPPFGGSADYAWSPDSRELAFTARFGRDQAWSTNTDVYTVSADGGEPVNATAGMRGGEQTPAYSPDGRYLAFLSQATPNYESDRWRLMVKDRTTGETREVPHAFDRWVGEYAWDPSSQGFIVIAEDHQQNRFFHVTLAGDVHHVHPGGNAAQFSLGGGTGGEPDVVAFVGDAVNRPADVYVWRIDHLHPAPPLQVTHLNADRLRALDLPAAEEIAWRGANADSVFGLLLKPPAFDPARRYPLLVLVHGGPQGAWLDQFHSRWNAELFAAPGYVVFMPNPRGSTGFGQRFINQIARDWGGKAYVDVLRGVDAVARLPFVDSTRMGAAGGSFGGHMINWINGHTSRFKVLVAHDGDFNLTSFYGATEELWFPEHDLGGPPWVDRTDYERWSPDKFAERMRTPELVIHGGQDFRVPDTEGLQAFTALQRRGVPSRLLYFPDEGHWVGKPQNQVVWWTTIHQWLGGYLSPGASVHP